MTDDPLIGRQLANFRIERVIGRGGMAQVYYGHDVKLQRPVAIKVIDIRYRGDPTYARRFVREAQTVATWRHENILQVYYADEQGDLYYFVMEYVDGPDLGKLMTQHAREGQLMPHDEVIRIGRAIARALDYAHRKGVIHRDVKPSNVMLASDGRVALADFGLALDVQQGTIGEVFGSANYIAPEQARDSSKAVPQSDLYALGVILYEMLAGSVPFDDPSPLSVSLQHVTRPPPPPRQLNPDLNPETEAVLLKALSKSPQERYQTGGELIDDLERALQIGPPPSPQPVISPTAEQAIQPQPAPRKGKRGVWIAMGLLVFAAIAAALGITWIRTQVGGDVGTLLSSLMALPTSSPSPLPSLRLSPTPFPSPSPSTPSPSPLTPFPSPSPSTPSPSPSPSTPSPSPSPSTPSPSPSPPTPSPTVEATAGAAALRPEHELYLPLIRKDKPPPQGRRFVIYYNEGGLYLLNDSGDDSQVAPLAFERLDASGEPLNRFEGWRWSRYYSTIQAKRCVRVEISGSTHSRPSQCRIYNSQFSASGSDDFIFWTPQEGSQQFRVLWDDEEVARCEIAAEVCEVFLP